MPVRKVPLAKNEIYHICSKSIAGFTIFNNEADYERMVKALLFFNAKNHLGSFSLLVNRRKNSNYCLNFKTDVSNKLVDIIAYCLMPTHLHLILKELAEGGISKFMHLVLNSYSRYFNLKYKRKGPLWEGRFKNILIETDEQLNHLTRYIHLNPVTAFLISNPRHWKFSSYNEYLGLICKNITNFSEYFVIDEVSYERFVNNYINSQRELSVLKNLTME